MDAALFAASTSLAVYLPRCVLGGDDATTHGSSAAHSLSMAVTIGLSLCIFSLCILEIAPSSTSSWFFLILSPDVVNNKNKSEGSTNIPADDSFGYLPISRCYWCLLWALTLVILVVLPSFLGTAVVESFGSYIFSSSSDDNKYPFVNYRKLPWWCRFLLSLFKMIITKLYLFVNRIFCRPNSGSNKNRSDSLPGGGLVMTINEDHEILRTSPSSDSLTPANSPTSSSSNTTSSNSHKFSASIGSICGVSVALVVVSSMGPLIVHTTTDKNALSILVSWLCAIGFMVSSILNGFGSVSMPYTCLSGLYLKPVRQEVFTKLEAEQRSVLEALASKRKMARELTLSVSSSRQPGRHHHRNSTTGTSNNNKLPTFTSFSDIGDDVTNRRRILQNEITFLEDLYKELGNDIEELRHTQIQAAAARTVMGRLRSYVGLLFSVILLVRLMSALWSIWKSYTVNTNRHKVSQGDIVTTILLWLTGHHLVSQESYIYLSQVVSLVMTLILSFTQMRTFLRAAAAVNRRFTRFYHNCNSCATRQGGDLFQQQQDEISFYAPGSTNNTSGEGILSQIIAMLTGCYCLSCIIVLKMMLPEEFCISFATALGGMDVFTIHTSFINGVFTFSAGISVAMLAILFGIQRQNNFRHVSSSSSLEKPTSFKGLDAV